MANTEFTKRINDLQDTDKNNGINNELKSLVENAKNTRLMRAASENSTISREHAATVAKEMKALDDIKKTELKDAVASIMNTLTATIDGETKTCAEILAKDRDWARKANIAELKQAAALVSLHYMIEKGKPLLYGTEAQEYAKQFCGNTNTGNTNTGNTNTGNTNTGNTNTGNTNTGNTNTGNTNTGNTNTGNTNTGNNAPIAPSEGTEVLYDPKLNESMERRFGKPNEIFVSEVFVPDGKGGYTKVIYNVGPDNSHKELGKLEFNENKKIKNSELAIKRYDEKEVKLTFDDTLKATKMESTELDKRLEKDRDALRNLTISGANPNAYNKLAYTTNPDGTSILKEEFIKTIVPDMDGNYRLQLTNTQSISLQIDDAGNITIKDNNTQKLQSGKSTLDNVAPEKQNELIYTGIDGKLVKVTMMGTDKKNLTFTVLTDPKDQFVDQADGQRKAIKDVYHNKEILDPKPTIPTITLPSFTDKPFNLSVESISLEDNNASLYNNGLGIVYFDGNPLSLTVPEKNENKVFAENEKENATNADLFDKYIHNGNQMSTDAVRNIKNSFYRDHFETKTTNLKPKGIVLKDPLTGSERYVSLTWKAGEIKNGVLSHKLDVTVNTAENKKIDDRMIKVNTFTKALDDVAKVNTVTANDFNGSIKVLSLEESLLESGNINPQSDKGEIYTAWAEKALSIEEADDKKDLVDDNGSVHLDRAYIQRQIQFKIEEDGKMVTKTTPVDFKLDNQGKIEPRLYGQEPGGKIKIGDQSYYAFYEKGQINLKLDTKVDTVTLPEVGKIRVDKVFKGNSKEAIFTYGYNSLLKITTGEVDPAGLNPDSNETYLTTVNNMLDLIHRKEKKQDEIFEAFKNADPSTSFTSLDDFYDYINKQLLNAYQQGTTKGILYTIDTASHTFKAVEGDYQDYIDTLQKTHKAKDTGVEMPLSFKETLEGLKYNIDLTSGTINIDGKSTIINNYTKGKEKQAILNHLIKNNILGYTFTDNQNTITLTNTKDKSKSYTFKTDSDPEQKAEKILRMVHALQKEPLPKNPETAPSTTAAPTEQAPEVTIDKAKLSRDFTAATGGKSHKEITILNFDTIEGNVKPKDLELNDEEIKFIENATSLQDLTANGVIDMSQLTLPASVTVFHAESLGSKADLPKNFEKSKLENIKLNIADMSDISIPITVRILDIRGTKKDKRPKNMNELENLQNLVVQPGVSNDDIKAFLPDQAITVTRLGKVIRNGTAASMVK